VSCNNFGTATRAVHTTCIARKSHNMHHTQKLADSFILQTHLQCLQPVVCGVSPFKTASLLLLLLARQVLLLATPCIPCCCYCALPPPNQLVLPVNRLPVVSQKGSCLCCAANSSPELVTRALCVCRGGRGGPVKIASRPQWMLLLACQVPAACHPLYPLLPAAAAAAAAHCPHPTS
jgi:hypothetical protein